MGSSRVFSFVPGFFCLTCKMYPCVSCSYSSFLLLYRFPLYEYTTTDMFYFWWAFGFQFLIFGCYVLWDAHGRAFDGYMSKSGLGVLSSIFGFIFNKDKAYANYCSIYKTRRGRRTKLDSLFNLQGGSAESFTPPAFLSTKEVVFRQRRGEYKRCSKVRVFSLKVGKNLRAEMSCFLGYRKLCNYFRGTQLETSRNEKVREAEISVFVF